MLVSPTIFFQQYAKCCNIQQFSLFLGFLQHLKEILISLTIFVNILQNVATLFLQMLVFLLLAAMLTDGAQVRRPALAHVAARP
jgi:hypothetical protein